MTNEAIFYLFWNIQKNLKSIILYNIKIFCLCFNLEQEYKNFTNLNFYYKFKIICYYSTEISFCHLLMIHIIKGFNLIAYRLCQETKRIKDYVVIPRYCYQRVFRYPEEVGDLSKMKNYF